MPLYICVHTHTYVFPNKTVHIFNYIFIDKYVSKVFISATHNFINPISYSHVIHLFKNNFYLLITWEF